MELNAKIKKKYKVKSKFFFYLVFDERNIEQEDTHGDRKWWKGIKPNEFRIHKYNTFIIK